MQGVYGMEDMLARPGAGRMVDGGYAILKRIVAVARLGNGKPRPSDSFKALDEHEDEGETGHLYIDRGEMWS
jgi:hypothetical protein